MAGKLKKLNPEDPKKVELDFKILANNIPQMAWITDPKGMVTWYNNRWYHYTGTCEDHIEAEAKGGSTHPDHLQKVTEGWLLSLSTGNEWEDTFMIRGSDGHYRWFLSRAIPIKDSQGTIVHWFGTNTDIDAQVIAEQKIIEARIGFEKLSEELQEALRARDEFLSIASHELKTPLTTMKLHTQMFKHKAQRGDATIYDHPNVDGFVDKFDKQVTRLNRLVDDMLDIARIRTGNLSIKREKFDLRELIMELGERMRPQFEELAGQFPQMNLDGPAVGNWDRLRIEQVITNLFTNAIRYGNGKPINVRLSALEDRVTFSIQDRGIGIPSHSLNKIFERFERVVAPSQVSGLGLGLYISKQIINAHGGKIWVDSKPELGSTFSLDLPYLEVL